MRHPTKVAMMDPLIRRFGIKNQSILMILTALGKTMADLPKQDSDQVLCWCYALRKCMYPCCCWKAKVWHVGCDAYTDTWANVACNSLNKGCIKLAEEKSHQSREEVVA